MSRTRQTATKTPQPIALAAEIDGLATLDLHALRVRWRKLTRREAPEHLGLALLIRIIAYRMQARIHGDLDADSVRQLDQIAGEHERRRRASTVKPKAVPMVAPAPRDRGHRPGTLFIREYAGEILRI